MTAQDHARITYHWLDTGRVSNHDHAILVAAQPLTSPFAVLLNGAVRAKVGALIQTRQRATTTGAKLLGTRSIQLFAHTPLGAAFIQS